MKMKHFAALICLAVAATSYAAEPPAPPADNNAAPTAPTENPQPTTAQPKSSLSETAMPRASSTPSREPKPAAAASRSPAPSSSATSARKTADRLELDTTNVTGNRELPKVLYIVPWKKADIGDLPGQPFNTLLDEVLAPVDRDVFRREVTYYGAIAAGTGAAAGESGPVSNSSHGSEK
jgi:type IV secretory pathway VirB10-like protein